MAPVCEGWPELVCNARRYGGNMGDGTLCEKNMDLFELGLDNF